MNAPRHRVGRADTGVNVHTENRHDAPTLSQ